MLTPTIKKRPVDGAVALAAQAEGYSPFQAALIGARLPPETIERAGGVSAAVAPALRQLDTPSSLPDIEIATDRIVRAIVQGEILACASDHDADGVASQAVLRIGLVDYLGVPAGRVQSYTTDKLSEGYGISEAFVDRLLAQVLRPNLLITADQGSCDESRIRRLRAAGIETIVTDHHGLPPEGPPLSAIATVNPVRGDSAFPDPAIAGCHVAWLVLAAVRARLVEGGWPVRPRSLADLLDIVGLGTTCDCVSLARSINNRAIVRAALRRANGPSPRPAWAAFNQLAKRDPGALVDEGTLGWTFGPRCNASGRVSSAMPGVRLLLASTLEEALPEARILEENNTHRKAIQVEMIRDAEDMAGPLLEAGHPVLVIWLPDGHVGVQGIVAAHMVRKTGRPAICMASPPKASELLSGSMRSVPGVHAKQLLDRVAIDNPGLLKKHGGHGGAAGLSIATRDFDHFRDAVQRAHIDLGSPPATGPVYEVDVDPPEIGTLAVLEEIEALGPYGMDFPAPLFKGEFELGARRPMGDGSHLRLTLHRGEYRYDAVWFGAGERQHALPARGTVLYRLARNTWQGRTRVDMQIEDIFCGTEEMWK